MALDKTAIDDVTLSIEGGYRNDRIRTRPNRRLRTR